ncbi:heavy metal translocating P-type ATPase [Congregibacter litoralis]|uniref:ATPase, P-type (Transporting), HAD superfamily, subfamily IC/heavy metal translocating P-type ATPase n=1 Tax=Congregibacter litoralis KT71 TaxID=314285 RepID=A4ABS9_9GAMM|nr:cation-translocating P-type ATPase [Congregibacter litoralis]EAQ96592.1 ATPase, P-type (transporting), HAD superfamily, subfamily IC/heavy metal translocating P-type ATPase [Congregibacter litoralis KT71]
MNQAVSALSSSAHIDELLIVDGMFCGGCASSLERRLGQLPGVVEASVDLAAGAALLRWRSGQQNADAARNVITSLGYTARRPGEEAAGDGVDAPERSLRLKFVVAMFFGMWTMLPSIGLYLDAAPNAAVAHGLAWAAAIASLPVILVCGRPFYAMAFATLRVGAAGIDALVSIGVAGAVALSVFSLAGGGADVYFEVAVALITLQLLARLIQLKVARRGRDALAQLLDLAPGKVARIATNGALEIVPVSQIAAGDLLLAEVGDTLAADGVVEGSDGLLDRHLLTGESRAIRVKTGDALCAGEVVVEGPLKLRVTGASGDRRIDALARQVRSTLMRKPDWQRRIDLVARYFLLLATIAAVIGGCVAVATGAGAIAVAERAIAVFVIACPCALSLAAPLAGLGATRRAVAAGILLRDLRVLTGAEKIRRVFLDKTGTLTEGKPVVCALKPVAGVSEGELLALAARVERHSRHPLATAIVREALARNLKLDTYGFFDRDEENHGQTPDHTRTVVGRGVRLESAATILRVGSAQWFEEEGLQCPFAEDEGFSRVWVARNDEVLGAIDLHDPLRPGARDAIEWLKSQGIAVTILSGDASKPVARIARELGVEGIARCSPEDKVSIVEDAAQGCATAFVGDGLNDGPAIAAADLGVAVENALDAARTASAATLLRGGVERVPGLLTLVSSAGGVLRQNIFGAVIYNLVAIPAALVGWVHPAVAAIAMAASSITIVLNSLRIREESLATVD